MPVYEYRCPECHFEFESLVRRFDEAATCPHCGCDHPKRLMSAPAAHGSDSSSKATTSVCPTSGKPCCPGCQHHH